MIGAWAEILEPVATRWLDECYKRAMREHRSGNPFQANELIRVWEKINASGEYRAWLDSTKPRLLDGPRAEPGEIEAMIRSIRESMGWPTGLTSQDLASRRELIREQARAEEPEEEQPA